MTNPEQPVAVTQADREWAADYWRDFVAKVGECMVENGIRAGSIDEMESVQRFARHRIAAEQAQRDQILAWCERNKIIGSGAAFFDAAFGALLSADDPDREVDGMDIALEMARAVRAQAYAAIRKGDDA